MYAVSYIREMIQDFYDSYQDNWFAPSFKKLKERLLAFYRVLKAMGIPFTGINELFSRARSLELTTIENLEYKIFFRLECLRGRGKSKKSLKHLSSLWTKLKKFSHLLAISHGYQTFLTYFTDFIYAEYRHLWIFPRIIDKLQLVNYCNKLKNNQIISQRTTAPTSEKSTVQHDMQYSEELARRQRRRPAVIRSSVTRTERKDAPRPISKQVQILSRLNKKQFYGQRTPSLAAIIEQSSPIQNSRSPNLTPRDKDQIK